MANGDNPKATWDFVFKLAQVAVLPLLACMVFLLMQIADIKQNQAIMQERLAFQMASLPRLDGLIAKLAVIEDRQATVMKRVDNIEAEFTSHRERSTYDPAAVRKK
jgi:hypothetical protein